MIRYIQLAEYWLSIMRSDWDGHSENFRVLNLEAPAENASEPPAGLFQQFMELRRRRALNPINIEETQHRGASAVVVRHD